MFDNPFARSQKVRHLNQDSRTLLENAQILDSETNILQHGSLFIEGGIITNIFLDEAAHSDEISGLRLSSEVIDLEQRVILPGLIDLHVHNTGRDRSRDFQDYFPKDDGLKLLRAATGLALTIEAGFTTVRSLGHGSPELVEQLKKAINLNLVNGPRVLSCGWAISQGGGHGNYRAWPYEWVQKYQPRSAFADGPLECQKLVRLNFGMGAEVIKIYASEGLITDDRLDIPNFTLEEIQAITTEAHRRGNKVAAHVVGTENVARAVKGGVDTIEHGTGASQETLEFMAEKGTVLVPTLSVFHRYEASGGWPRNDQPMSERQAELIEAALVAGVKIGCGSDTGTPIAGQNAKELILLSEAGLSIHQTIEAATTIAAEALGLGHEIGKIQKGFLADLLILEGDPLQNIEFLQQPERLWKVIRSQPHGPGSS